MPDADVVVATWWETAEWVARLSPSKGAKAYFIQQFEANFDQPLDRVEATWRLPLHKIVCARWLYELARDRYGDPHASVVPNGIDLELFHAPPRDKQQRPTIGVMYSTSPPKAWGVALAALAELSRRVPDLRVRSFGFLEPISSLPIAPEIEIEYRPPQHRLREIYSSCDVWLCASSSEGYHLPPHEAMACRCPVVSTRVGGPMDLIEDGVNGYLVEPFDACMLADRAARILNLPEPDWRRMSATAYDTVQRYTWVEATDLFERAIETAVERAVRGQVTGERSGARS